jgi:hypothetical protein
MRKFFRNANIGLAVAAAVLAVGFWPTYRSETAFTVLGFVAFAVGMGVYIALNLRYERAQDKKARPPRSS